MSKDAFSGTPSTAVCDVLPRRMPLDLAATLKCAAAIADVPRLWKDIRVLPPKFEQRTIKFEATLRIPRSRTKSSAKHRDGGDADASFPSEGAVDEVEVIIKVPQASFPLEPFAEAIAFAMDTAVLQIGRIPPTALVALPLEHLRAVVEHDSPHVQMVEEFHPDPAYTFAKWATADFFDFVRGGDRSSHMMKNRTHVWASAQLRLKNVVPILDSPLKVPYSKAKPGWHRWFNPSWPERNVTLTSPHHPAVLYALSQLSMFDFIMLNSDRSPNKNNFVLLGCGLQSMFFDGKKKKKRRHNENKSDPKHAVVGADVCDETTERGQHHLSMAFVHLDQGMALYGFPQAHNPIAKKKNNTFCLFFEPLYRRVKCLVEWFQTQHDPDALLAWGLEHLPDAAVKAVGQDRVYKMLEQLPALLKRVDSCDYPETKVMMRDESLGFPVSVSGLR